MGPYSLACGLNDLSHLVLNTKKEYLIQGFSTGRIPVQRNQSSSFTGKITEICKMNDPDSDAVQER